MELLNTPVRVFSIANGDLKLAISKINPDKVFLLWSNESVTTSVFDIMFTSLPISQLNMDGQLYNAVSYTNEVDSIVKSLADILVNLRITAPNALAHKFQIELPMSNGSK